MITSPQFIAICAGALQSAVEITLLDLMSALQLDDQLPFLTKVQSVEEALRECRFELIPAHTTGSLDSIRLLKAISDGSLGLESVTNEMDKGETANQEFKSSLMYDHMRKQNVPDTPVSQLKSEDVIYETLKTISAFLNSGGGILYIGIDNSGTWIGIQHDYTILGSGKHNEDGWQLYLRDLITTRLKDGSGINDYLKMSFLKKDAITICRLEIYRRKKLSLLRKGTEYKVYRRQGNRSAEVRMDEIEEFLEMRQKQT